MSHPNRKYATPAGLYVAFIIAVMLALPGAYLGMTHAELSPVVGAVLFGLAIFCAATILSWAAEVAQIDISQSLAVAIMALLAVLPEYAVDFIFTWKAGQGSEEAHHYAIANMTGANRLLVGFGWPVILFLFVWFKKKKEVILKPDQRNEIFYLGAATIYSFTIPLKGDLNLIDTVILVTLYILYAHRSAKTESEEPELVGPVKIVANMKVTPRRVVTYAMFGFAGLVIFFVAEPFTESLVEAGTVLGIDRFLLVQWLAPFASEAPEFIIAATWSMRGEAAAAMKALISSKVNHWTLLIGSIPLVYVIAAGKLVIFDTFVLDDRQNHELILTAAQSLFAVSVLVTLRLNKLSGLLLLVLFFAQFIVPEIRMEVAAVYMVFALIYLFRQRSHLLPIIKTGFGKK